MGSASSRNTAVIGTILGDEIIFKKKLRLFQSLQSALPLFERQPSVSCHASKRWGAFQKHISALKSKSSNKIPTLYEYHIFQCAGKIFYGEFQKWLLKLCTNIFEDIERYVSYSQLKISELLDLWPCKCIWNGPLKKLVEYIPWYYAHGFVVINYWYYGISSCGPF